MQDLKREQLTLCLMLDVSEDGIVSPVPKGGGADERMLQACQELNVA